MNSILIDVREPIAHFFFNLLLSLIPSRRHRTVDRNKSKPGCHDGFFRRFVPPAAPVHFGLIGPETKLSKRFGVQGRTGPLRAPAGIEREEAQKGPRNLGYLNFCHPKKGPLPSAWPGPRLEFPPIRRGQSQPVGVRSPERATDLPVCDCILKCNFETTTCAMFWPPSPLRSVGLTAGPRPTAAKPTR